NRDITELRKAELALRQRESELAEQNVLLHQKNAALRELMRQVDAEKKKTGDLIQANIEQLVLPALAKLKTRCREQERVYVAMAEDNLRDIVAPFGSGMSGRINHLTSREIELCTMIKQGMSSKEIARALAISPRTVDTHRNRIRKKLGMSGPEINMATFLKNELHRA
ncbi:MAG: hypothetical protein JXA71_20715, partial [Chitinispirillaceae bacterium]|nr:hypothetical protein [Chitinispirillaceae bacterium]